MAVSKGVEDGVGGGVSGVVGVGWRRWRKIGALIRNWNNATTKKSPSVEGGVSGGV